MGALADRHLRKVRGLHDRVFTPDVVYLPLPVLLDRLIDPFVELHTECPAFAHLLLGADTSADIADATCALDGEIVDRLAGLFRQLAPGLDAARARLVASVSKSNVKALMSSVAAEARFGRARRARRRDEEDAARLPAVGGIEAVR